MLREYTDDSADEVFADWVLANYFLDSRRGYGYRSLEADLEPPQPVAGINSFPASYEGSLPQHSSDYFTVDVRGADNLFVRLWQAPEARLIDAAPVEGGLFRLRRHERQQPQQTDTRLYSKRAPPGLAGIQHLV